MSDKKRLLSSVTEHHAFDSIMANEETLDGTYQVVNEIFQKQLGYDSEKNFTTYLQLIFDDQKTVSLLHSIQKKRRESKRSYHSLN